VAQHMRGHRLNDTRPYLPHALRHQPLVPQRLLQRFITGLRQHLRPDLHGRLALLATVLLLHSRGRLRVVLHVDVPVCHAEAVQLPARALHIPTPIGPIDLNHAHRPLSSALAGLMDNPISRMDGGTLSTLGPFPRPVNRGAEAHGAHHADANPRLPCSQGLPAGVTILCPGHTPPDGSLDWLHAPPGVTTLAPHGTRLWLPALGPIAPGGGPQWTRV
jgi:hypothetical protein